MAGSQAPGLARERHAGTSEPALVLARPCLLPQALPILALTMPGHIGSMWASPNIAASKEGLLLYILSQETHGSSPALLLPSHTLLLATTPYSCAATP